MQGQGLSSGETLYIRSKYETKPLTDKFIEIRKSKNTLKRWDWTDITDKFEGGAMIFYR